MLVGLCLMVYCIKHHGIKRITLFYNGSMPGTSIKKTHSEELGFSGSGGDCEIRTHGRLPVGSFQDCWFKPLTQVSG